MGIVRTTGQENDLYSWGWQNEQGKSAFVKARGKGIALIEMSSRTRTSAVSRDNKDDCLETACGKTMRRWETRPEDRISRFCIEHPQLEEVLLTTIKDEGKGLRNTEDF